MVSGARVRAVFVIGPPRTGTTLLSHLLAGVPGVLSVSEPFLVHAVVPHWRLHRFLCRFQKSAALSRVSPPRACSADRLFAFLRELAARNSLPVLAIKETFRAIARDSAWDNVGLLDRLVTSGGHNLAIIRQPYDTTVSTMKLLRGVVGFRGRLTQKFVFPNCPTFANHTELVRWISANWVRHVDWARGHRLTVVRYEDLVADPRQWLRRICQYCDLPFDERMLDHRQPRTAFGGIGAVEVLNRPPRPVHKRSVGRGGTLSPELSEIVRTTCAQHAAEFGYEL
jgi:hypothetical protein